MVDAHIRYSRCKLNLDSDMTALSAPLAPPDRGYGWVMVLAIFWNNAHDWGILSVRRQPHRVTKPSSWLMEY
jgi:hypothetical protein